MRALGGAQDGGLADSKVRIGLPESRETGGIPPGRIGRHFDLERIKLSVALQQQVNLCACR